MKTMPAGEFKAKCLAVMDEVHARREPVVITKRGKPVTKLVPVELEVSGDSIFGCMRDKMTIVGDANDWVKPIVPEEDWSNTWEPSE